MPEGIREAGAGSAPWWARWLLAHAILATVIVVVLVASAPGLLALAGVLAGSARMVSTVFGPEATDRPTE